jgi:hypothetical protein
VDDAEDDRDEPVLPPAFRRGACSWPGSARARWDSSRRKKRAPRRAAAALAPIDAGSMAAIRPRRLSSVLSRSLWNAGSVSGDGPTRDDGTCLDQLIELIEASSSCKPTKDRRRCRPHAFLGEENPSFVSECVDMNTPQRRTNESEHAARLVRRDSGRRSSCSFE